ncbi:MAG: hypothetical protein QOE70_6510 [Chthoniobacter sp.]|jgi:glycosidase|nr:hypothetical protein [Chthoniobacter sp.]
MSGLRSANFSVTLDARRGAVLVECSAPGVERLNQAVFVALETDLLEGCAVLPFQRQAEGSTVFLPFRADRVYAAQMTDSGVKTTMRCWQRTIWSERSDVHPEFSATVESGMWRLSIPLAVGGSRVGVAVFAKDLNENQGWGAMLASDHVAPGPGDRYVRRYSEIDLTTGAVAIRGRLATGSRARIYQLLPRLFGNINETRKPNGSLAENGVGKFADLNAAALDQLRASGFTHLWLTGVLRQVTATDYSSIGLPADDPDLLKGLAGSPYAIKDAFDVCPDYAEDPARRLDEFQALLARIHAVGLRAIIDFVPNHVARSYASVVRPDLSFGARDDHRKFFDPRNNFFYLQPDSPGGGPPLRLPTFENGEFLTPTCQALGAGDGFYDGEREFGRVTGNNAVTWRPSRHDWYETVKLNYGYDFTTGQRAYPHGHQPDLPIPDTWLKMDAILAYWQDFGVDGFRCDMAHLVPSEFWNWAVARARLRQPDVFFIGEGYDTDPAKVPCGDPLLASIDGGNVFIDLLNAGFNAVYGDPAYKKLKNLYDGTCWANDLEGALGNEFIFQHSICYAENHDEVRLAGRDQWGGIGMEVGRPVSAVLFGLSRGPVLVYSGQEVGEPAAGVEGFGGDDARTTIFDYWSMPELAKWVNGHRYDGGRLSRAQAELKSFYARLLRLVDEPAFRDGEFFGLNPANVTNASFGRSGGESASGHWVYSFLRYDAASGQRFLVIANLHRDQSWRDLRIVVPSAALSFLDLDSNSAIRLVERLGAVGALQPVAQWTAEGVAIDDLPALTAFYFELLL